MAIFLRESASGCPPGGHFLPLRLPKSLDLKEILLPLFSSAFLLLGDQQKGGIVFDSPCYSNLFIEGINGSSESTKGHFTSKDLLA
ncbi:MAG: hypothetical protein DMG06_01055 [Acidobacteria bacterium]|nr:MAG: hypothetical protein DMG06_01055 [Acidobacteriota bacterium]